MKTSTGWKITNSNTGGQSQWNAYKDGFGIAHHKVSALLQLLQVLDAEQQTTTTAERDAIQDHIDRLTFERLFGEYSAEPYGIGDYDYFRLCQLARKFNINLNK